MDTNTDELAARRVRNLNLCTPEEAATRQCRVVGLVVQPTPFVAATWNFPACAGPACMHWRWVALPASHGEVAITPPTPKWGGQPNPHQSGRGYCGQGGAP